MQASKPQLPTQLSSKIVDTIQSPLDQLINKLNKKDDFKKKLIIAYI